MGWPGLSWFEPELLGCDSFPLWVGREKGLASATCGNTRLSFAREHVAWNSQLVCLWYCAHCHGSQNWIPPNSCIRQPFPSHFFSTFLRFSRSSFKKKWIWNGVVRAPESKCFVTKTKCLEPKSSFVPLILETEYKPIVPNKSGCLIVISYAP